MRAVSICLALLVAAAAGAAVPPAHFSHKDWEIACDNTGTCRTAGYAPDTGENGFSLLLQRPAGPGTGVQGRLRFGGFDDQVAPRGALRLWLNGRDLGPLAAAVDGVHRLHRVQTAALLAALPRRAAITVSDAAGARWTISDAGASAVLLRMDEAQGRLGTPGALVRVGTRAENSVPAPTPLAALRPAPALQPTRPADAALAGEPVLRAALRASLPPTQDCDGLRPGDDALPLEVERLDDRRLLVSTRCWRGAYNEGNGYWVVNDHAPWAPAQVTLDGSDFERYGASIVAAQKGRGLGDCFWTARWRWQGTGFVLAHEQTSGQCRGFAGGAWDLPTHVSAGQ